MDQSQEILLDHSVFASREYGYHGYRHIAVRLAIQYMHTWILKDECVTTCIAPIKQKNASN